MSKTYSSVVGNNESISTKSYLKIAEKMGIDLAFQSEFRWLPDKQQNYINSRLMGKNLSKFIIVDVLKCRDNCSPNSIDWDYYNRYIEKGIYYLNIDSNNRTLTLQDFFDGNITIPSGTYIPKDKRINYVVNNNNNTYKTMDEDFRLEWLNNKIDTFVITESTREELSDTFQRMNDGVPLNREEKLNCSYSDQCDGIRELAAKYGDIIVEAKFITEKEKKRRKVDGWFANIFYLYVLNSYNKPFGQKVHEKFYTRGNAAEKMIVQFKKDWKKYMKLVGDKIKLFHYRWVFFDLFFMIHKQETVKIEDNQGNTIQFRLKDNSSIVMDFIKMITKLIADKTQLYTFDQEAKDRGEVVELFSFRYLAKGEGKNTPVRMKAYKDYGFDITKYFTEIDANRGYDPIEKQAAADRDGWKTNEGDDIIPETLHDGEYDAGHIVAHADGGETTMDNLVIENASKYRSKKRETTIVSNK